jgi:hypothetical protein
MKVEDKTPGDAIKRLDDWRRKTQRWTLGVWFGASNLLWILAHPGRAVVLLPVAAFVVMLLDVALAVTVRRVAPPMRKS